MDDKDLHHLATRPPHMHTYIHTYIHTYVRTYIHTYIHTYILQAESAKVISQVGGSAADKLQVSMSHVTEHGKDHHICRAVLQISPVLSSE